MRSCFRCIEGRVRAPCTLGVHRVTCFWRAHSPTAHWKACYFQSTKHTSGLLTLASCGCSFAQWNARPPLVRHCYVPKSGSHVFEFRSCGRAPAAPRAAAVIALQPCSAASNPKIAAMLPVRGCGRDPIGLLRFGWNMLITGCLQLAAPPVRCTASS